MKISELGEFGLIDLVSKAIKAVQPQELSNSVKPELVIGIGDDTAAWRLDGGIELATTDTLVQDVHFSFDNATWRELGWKALAVNMSDVASMGGFATYALVTLGLSKDTEVEDVVELYKGILDVGVPEGVLIAGGDMVSSPVVFITIALTGIASADSDGKPVLLLRSEAKIGDLVAVTGCLGTSGAGLRMLFEGIPLDTASRSVLRKAHLTPIPRMQEGRALVGAGIKAAMDVSDGLVLDLEKICRASKVGARVYLDRLPIDPAVRANFPNTCFEMALSGGEDYELLFTGSEDQIEKVRKASKTPVTVIGEIVTDPNHHVAVIDEDGKERPLAKSGWDHFTV